MAAQKGRDVLIKMQISGTYTSIGGLRQKSMRLSNGHSDVSDSDSLGQWREMLAGTGLKTMSVSGGGVFKDSASEGTVLSNFLASATPNFQFIVPGMGTFQGAFVITGMDAGGGHDSEVSYSMSFESAGEITFTAA